MPGTYVQALDALASAYQQNRSDKHRDVCSCSKVTSVSCHTVTTCPLASAQSRLHPTFKGTTGLLRESPTSSVGGTGLSENRCPSPSIPSCPQSCLAPLPSVPPPPFQGVFNSDLQTTGPPQCPGQKDKNTFRFPNSRIGVDPICGEPPCSKKGLKQGHQSSPSF